MCFATWTRSFSDNMHEQPVMEKLQTAIRSWLTGSYDNVSQVLLITIIHLLFVLDCLEKCWRIKLNLSLKLQVLDVFGRTVHCKANWVNCLLNPGTLTQLLPAWGDVQLSGGWSLFWGEARKVAKVVTNNPTGSVWNMLCCASSSPIIFSSIKL